MTSTKNACNKNYTFQVNFQFGDTTNFKALKQYSLNYSCETGEIESIGDLNQSRWLFSAYKNKENKIDEFQLEVKPKSARIVMDCKMNPKEMLVSKLSHIKIPFKFHSCLIGALFESDSSLN